MPVTSAALASRLSLVIIGNAFLRISSGASGVLVGLYLADLAGRGFHVNAALAGTLGAVSFGAELIGAVPMGIASDALAPRGLMSGGAILGAAAVSLFSISKQPGIFFLSRCVEGLGAAAVTPPLLAHLTDVTFADHSLRSRMMSYFELSLLAGLALGGLTAAQLWHHLYTGAFGAVALIYVLCAALLFAGAAGSRGHGTVQAVSGLYRALGESSLRRLAPAWLCVNAIVGLWLAPTLPFLLTQKNHSGQFLDGIYASQPERIGWLLLGYSLIFGAGVIAWSFVLPRMSEQRALRIALVAMVAVCVGLSLLNHSSSKPALIRWMLGVVTAVCIMIESGFTPAALSLLAGALGAQAGRGAAMGIYAVLLSIGAIAGSLVAAILGQLYAVDGLIYGTFVMAFLALIFVRWIHMPPQAANG